MIMKMRTEFNWLQITVLFYLVHLVTSVLDAGSCSDTCQNESTKHCSCTSSCKIYDDCCYDSQFRNAAQNISNRTICLSMLNGDQFKAVASCSSEWEAFNNLCADDIGRQALVTSRTSGVTYANRICALCNDDDNDLVIWNVTLKCCPEHDDGTENLSEPRFVFEDGNLKRVVDGSASSLRNCICKYNASDYSFLDLLELRDCDYSNIEISTCPTTWQNETVRNLCTSFEEPVLAGPKIYKNLYCAQCNYENLNSVHCLPEDFSSYDHCMENNLQDCLQFRDMGKAKLRPRNRLFRLGSPECVPPSGRRCCEGQKLHPLTKTCTKLVQG